MRARALVVAVCVVLGGSGVVGPRDAGAGAALEPLLIALKVSPMLGQAPATLALPRLADGKTVTLASLKGRPVLVYFWATW